MGNENSILQEPSISDEIVKAIENTFQDVPEMNVVNKYPIGNRK
jgi:hypothetical protein